MKRRKGQECKIGIKNLGTGLQLRRKREFNKIFKKTLGLEIGKPAVGISSGLRTIKDWALWRGRLPPKRSKSHSHVLHKKSRKCVNNGHLDNFAPPCEKKWTLVRT
jgi:hypothetical protein